MAALTSDMEIKKKGLAVLFKNLGEVDAIRFLSQVSYEKRDYVTLQEDIFADMTVEDIYKKAKEYAERRQ